MKKFWVAGVVGLTLACGSTALALDEIGNPAAMLQAGKFSVGADVNHSEREIDLDMDVLGLDITQSARVERTSVAVVPAFGVTDWLEVFVRLGAAWPEADNAIGMLTEEELHGDASLLLGGGIRVRLPKITDRLFPGVTLQANYYRLEDGIIQSGTFGGVPVVIDEDLEADLLDVTLAGGLTYLTESFAIYGGVFSSWTFGDGDLDITINGVPVAADLDVREDGNLGGFLGASFIVVEGVSLSVNGHLMEGGWGAGAAVTVSL